MFLQIRPLDQATNTHRLLRVSQDNHPEPQCLTVRRENTLFHVTQSRRFALHLMLTDELSPGGLREQFQHKRGIFIFGLSKLKTVCILWNTHQLSPITKFLFFEANECSAKALAGANHCGEIRHFS